MLKVFGGIIVSSEAMIFNKRQGVVLDDIARWWKWTKRDHLEEIPCIFFVDRRGDSFHVTYSPDADGLQVRDQDFRKLSELM